ESLAESYWLHQALHRLFGSVKMDKPVSLHEDDRRVRSASSLFESYLDDKRRQDILLEDRFEEFMNRHKHFCRSLSSIKAGDVIEPLAQLQHLDSNIAHSTWLSFFPLVWAASPKEDRSEVI